MFLSLFGLYLMTAAPAVTFWDSGELIAASSSLGVSHQPGYPVFDVLGRAFSFLPFGSVASRACLLSAFFSAAAAWVVYLILKELLDGASALPVAMALWLGLVRIYWSQAVVAEVYALNSLFLALLMLSSVKAARGALCRERHLALSGLMFGLGLVNHESLVLYLPALLLGWLAGPGGSGRGRLTAAIVALGFMLLGLSAYLYLPLRSLATQGINIGHPDSLGRFLWVVKWGEYARHARDIALGAAGVVGGLPWRSPALLAAAAASVLAALALIRRSWRLYLPLLVYVAVYGLVISAQTRTAGSDARFGLGAKFYIPVFIAGVVLAGGVVREFLGQKAGYLRHGLAALFLAASGYLVYSNYAPDDMSRNFIAHDYAANSLKSAGENGVLFTWGDNGAFPLWYMQEVERYRDDVVLVHAPLMTYRWYLGDLDKRLANEISFMGPYFLGENVYRVVKKLSPGRSVAYDFSSTRFLNLEKEDISQRGLVYFEGRVPPGDPWPGYVFRGVDDPGVSKGAMETNIIAIYQYMRGLAPPTPGRPSSSPRTSPPGRRTGR